jgi:hypothetical protein
VRDEGALHEQSEPRPQERQPEAAEHDDGQRAGEAIRQPHAVDHGGERDDRDRVREHQPRDHAERPSATARGAGRKERRQNGQNAWGYGRSRTGEDGEDHQERHLGPQSRLCFFRLR